MGIKTAANYLDNTRVWFYKVSLFSVHTFVGIHVRMYVCIQACVGLFCGVLFTVVGPFLDMSIKTVANDLDKTRACLHNIPACLMYSCIRMCVCTNV